jgi:hypothetical protein
MSQAAAHISLNGSRLVRFLSDLQVSDAAMTQKRFAERLGSLIDLSDSITLSSAHSNIGATAFEASGLSQQDAQQEFLRVRAAIVQGVIKSFAPHTGPTRIKLPVPEAETPTDASTAFEPYRKFYTAQQRDIDFKIRKLQLQMREAAAGFSPELAQLSALDTALGDTLAIHTRKFFAVIPGLLGKRFEHLYQQHPSWMAMHKAFCADMQGLLLAEIEARLLPVLGLVEALDSNTDTDTDKKTL